MNLKLVLTLLILSVGTAGAAPSTPVESAAHPHPQAKEPCTELAALTNRHTPEDIFRGIRLCIQKGRYDLAAPLYALACTYGRYDARRVTDPNTHRTIRSLLIDALADASQEKRQAFQKAILSALEKRSPEKTRICELIREIGPPDYYPAYMLSGSPGTFGDDKKHPIQEDFDREGVWNEVLTDYLNCPG